jgi:hypothetical protein
MRANNEIWRVAVVIFSRDRAHLLATCLSAFLLQLDANTAVMIVVHDASEVPFIDTPATAALPTHPNVRVVRRAQTGESGTVRIAGLQSAKQLGVEIAVLLDSDCVQPHDYVQSHLAQHRETPDAAFMGAAMAGVGTGIWSRADSATSWLTSMLDMAGRDVHHPVHLPTLNIHLKLAAIALFVECLRHADEDTQLVLDPLRKDRRIVYAGSPVLRHFERVRFAAGLQHHFFWGCQTYWIRLGFDTSLAKQILYKLGILIAWAAYAILILASYYILSAWLQRRPPDQAIAPIVLTLSTAKAVAVSCGVLFPHFVLHPGC